MLKKQFCFLVLEMWREIKLDLALLKENVHTTHHHVPAHPPKTVPPSNVNSQTICAPNLKPYFKALLGKILY